MNKFLGLQVKSDKLIPDKSFRLLPYKNIFRRTKTLFRNMEINLRDRKYSISKLVVKYNELHRFIL